MANPERGTSHGRPQRKIPPRNRFIVARGRQVTAAQPPPKNILDPKLSTLILRLEIETLSPLFTGAGYFESGPAKALLERQNQPIVAGSSIKGACRQLHEVLTASGDPFSGEDRGASASLFGILGHAGRASFDDALPAALLLDGAAPEQRRSLPKPERIRLSVAYAPGKDAPNGRRFYGLMPKGADQPPAVPALAFPKGTFLATLLRVENLRKSEIGSLLVALGIAPEMRFTPRLGGGKYDTFGWVRFHLRAFKIWKGLGRHETWVTEVDRVDSFRDETIQAFLAEKPPGLNTFRNSIVSLLQGPDPQGGPR